MKDLQLSAVAVVNVEADELIEAVCHNLQIDSKIENAVDVAIGGHEIETDQIEGLDNKIEQAVEDALSGGLDIDADQVEGLGYAIEEYIEDSDLNGKLDEALVQIEALSAQVQKLSMLVPLVEALDRMINNKVNSAVETAQAIPAEVTKAIAS